MTLTRLIPLLALVACSDDPASGPTFAAPADGQSAVPVDAPLIAQAPSLALPPDYPAPAAIRVVDLSTDGFVDGTVSQQDGLLTFTPDRPWRRNARYAWTVDIPESLPHGPQFTAPAGLEDSAVFDTSSDLDLLAASQGNDLCVVLSRPASVAELNAHRTEVDDVIVDDPEWTLLDDAEWQADVPALTADDEGLGVACLIATTGATVRLSDDDGSSLVEVTADPPDVLVASLYRSAP